jgi:hypothetical protein
MSEPPTKRVRFAPDAVLNLKPIGSLSTVRMPQTSG